MSEGIPPTGSDVEAEVFLPKHQLFNNGCKGRALIRQLNFVAQCVAAGHTPGSVKHGKPPSHLKVVQRLIVVVICLQRP